MVVVCDDTRQQSQKKWRHSSLGNVSQGHEFSFRGRRCLHSLHRSVRRSLVVGEFDALILGILTHRSAHRRVAAAVATAVVVDNEWCVAAPAHETC